MIKEISDFANELLDAQWNITPETALQLAVKIQQNRIIQDAFSVPTPGAIITYPPALEAIAMVLGYKDKAFSCTIQDALYDLTTAIKEKDLSY